MRDLKKLTLLHSNDMHGDFLSKQVDTALVGGVSMLSGYLNKVRSEEQNVLYVIAGDMFRGSLIDSEFKGISTIEIMNFLSPDVVTLGNHEVDYGFAHLLFIEKCAKFPIINANLYLTTNGMRLFNSHIIGEIDGMRILFIGILTEQVLRQTKADKLIGSLIDVEDAVKEVTKIINAYQTEDIDFTVLLTHIGIEEDKRLAEQLDPRLGVDLIIGGHSHTLLDEPVVINGIPIVQAASGTNQIGRFDIVVDKDNNCIDSYTWSLIPIDSSHCDMDTELKELILNYKARTDEKYDRIVTRFARTYTHPARQQETDLGHIMADAFQDMLEVDIVFLGSGSIRKTELGPVVRYRDLLETMPYNDSVHRILVNGDQLRHMVTHILSHSLNTEEHTEFYQFSRGLRAEFDTKTNTLISLSLNGYEVKSIKTYSVALQDYHLKNIQEFMGVSIEEVSKYKKPKTIATNSTDILEEYFSHEELVRVSEDRRFILE